MTIGIAGDSLFWLGLVEGFVQNHWDFFGGEYHDQREYVTAQGTLQNTRMFYSLGDFSTRKFWCVSLFWNPLAMPLLMNLVFRGYIFLSSTDYSEMVSSSESGASFVIASDILCTKLHCRYQLTVIIASAGFLGDDLIQRARVICVAKFVTCVL